MSICTEMTFTELNLLSLKSKNTILKKEKVHWNAKYLHFDKNLEEISWRRDTVWNILVHFGSFLVDCRRGFSQSSPFNWLREFLLTVPQTCPPSFMFKCWFPVFNPGHHIFLWIQEHLDLGKPPFMFAVALLSHARALWAVCDLQAPTLWELRVLSILQRLWHPMACGEWFLKSFITEFPWKNPELGLWAEGGQQGEAEPSSGELLLRGRANSGTSFPASARAGVSF